MTNETNPSYLLARSGNATTLPAPKAAVLIHPSCSLVEVVERLLDHFKRVAVT